MTSKGTCELCLNENVELLMSHIASSWLYRKPLKLTTEGSSSLVKVANGTSMLSSKQEKKYLLCDACEDLLGRRETYASSVMLQPDGTFPIRDLIIISNRNGYAFIDITGSDFDIDKLTYFALSVFWRADVAQSDPIVDLCGDREGIRKYLHQEGPIPDSVDLLVRVLDPSTRDSPVDRVLMFPQTQSRSDYHVFAGAGIRFDLFGNHSFPDKLKTLSFPRNSVVVIDPGDHILRSVLKEVRGSCIVGKLAAEQTNKDKKITE